jgi:flagellar basal-body rod protein FlgF
MDRLIFTAMASLKQLNNMKLKHANALANASTVGFKQTFEFATTTSKVAGAGFGSRYVPMNRSNDELVIDQGPLIATGRKLDIYMTGSSLLGVQSPDGQTAFTRRGDLTVDQAGLLSTANGHVVLGEGGAPITAPVGVELAITADGTVTATDPAQPDAPPTIVGNLLLRDATGVRMVRRVDGLYETITAKGKGGDFQSGPNPPRVQSGSLEGSSINVAEQLVSFMDMSRSFEIKIKMISEMKELDDSGTTMMKYA